MEWKVTFEGGFWGQHGSAGEELGIKTDFIWSDEFWKVLAVYVLDKEEP